jgi:hypothetical protein
MVKELVTLGMFIVDGFYTTSESGELTALEASKDQVKAHKYVPAYNF